MTYMQRLLEIVPLRFAPKVFPMIRAALVVSSGNTLVGWERTWMNTVIYILSDTRRKGQLGREGQPAGPSPSRAQLQYVGMKGAGTGAADPFHETLPGWHGGAGHSCEGFAQSPGSPESVWNVATGSRELADHSGTIQLAAPPRNPPPSFLMNIIGTWLGSYTLTPCTGGAWLFTCKIWVSIKHYFKEFYCKELKSYIQ